MVYDPAATAPTWERFLRRVLPDPELRAYIQRVMGYTLTGSVEEQCLFFFYGSGRNGKTTFLELMRHLLGDYAHKAPSELLLASKDNAGARDDVAALQGRRFVVTAEIDEGRAMAEALMKQLTGGETVTARKLYANAVSFEPTWKIFLGANTKPVVRSANDYAVWRRIKLIPFEVRIPDDEVDEQLPAKLIAEGSGILNWMIAGLRDWRSGGLQEPAIVRDQVDAYRAESDTVGQFLDECCVAQADARVRPAALYNAYVKWCEGRKERPKTLTIFGQTIQERGFEKRKSDGYPTYIGIGLKAEEEGF
jgi:putative DNA primase/helicase